MTRMFSILALLSLARGAVLVALPATEAVAAWTEPLALAGLAVGQPGSGVGALVTAEGGRWRVTIRDERGVPHEVTIPVPTTPQSREDLAWLIASLSHGEARPAAALPRPVLPPEPVAAAPPAPRPAPRPAPKPAARPPAPSPLPASPLPASPLPASAAGSEPPASLPPPIAPGEPAGGASPLAAVVSPGEGDPWGVTGGGEALTAVSAPAPDPAPTSSPKSAAAPAEAEPIPAAPDPGLWPPGGWIELATDVDWREGQSAGARFAGAGGVAVGPLQGGLRFVIEPGARLVALERDRAVSAAGGQLVLGWAPPWQVAPTAEVGIGGELRRYLQAGEPVASAPVPTFHLGLGMQVSAGNLIKIGPQVGVDLDLRSTTFLTPESAAALAPAWKLYGGLAAEVGWGKNEARAIRTARPGHDGVQ